MVAGAFAKMALQEKFPNLEVRALTKSIFNIEVSKASDEDFFEHPVTGLGFLNQAQYEKAAQLLTSAKQDGESYGGVVEVRVKNPVKSLGQPVFGKFKAHLASAILSLGAVKSFSLGDEVDLKSSSGTEFHSKERSVYGGVSGGLTTGDTIKFFCDVKPTSSILDVSKKGRHDPCIVPRLLVVIESMVWMVLMDLYLQRKVETG